jgi:membrane protein
MSASPPSAPEAHTASGPVAPWRMSAADWKAIGAGVFHQFNEDRLLAIAGGVVFYALLAIFPAITAFVSLYGLFADPTTVAKHLSLVQELLPSGAFSIFQDQADRAANSGAAQLGLTSLLALLFAIWSANTGTKAIMDALNVVYNQTETRSFLKFNFVSMVLTLGTMAALMLALTGVVVLPLVLAAFGVDSIGDLEYLRWPLLLVLILAGLAVLYRYGPSRKQPHWSWLSVGAVAAGASWIGTSALLSWYLSNVANYNAIYGSLGAVVGLMMWMWVTTIVVLVGAELDAQIAERARSNNEGLS